MPHYPRYGLRWGKVWICIPENYNSPPTGEVLAIYKPPHTPTNLAVAKPGVSGDGDLHDCPCVSFFFLRLSVQVGFILSYSNQETLRLALALGALAFVYRFLLMLQIPTTSGNFSDQFPH